MSGSTPFSHVVRIEFRPYRYGDVQALLKQVHREFGPPGPRQRWRFCHPSSANKKITPTNPAFYLNPIEQEENYYALDFAFRDVNDAMMFGIKYQR